MDEIASGEDVTYEILTKIKIHDRYYKRKCAGGQRSISRRYNSIESKYGILSYSKYNGSNDFDEK